MRTCAHARGERPTVLGRARTCTCGPAGAALAPGSARRAAFHETTHDFSKILVILESNKQSFLKESSNKPKTGPNSACGHKPAVLEFGLLIRLLSVGTFIVPELRLQWIGRSRLFRSIGISPNTRDFWLNGPRRKSILKNEPHFLFGGGGMKKTSKICICL